MMIQGIILKYKKPIRTILVVLVVVFISLQLWNYFRYGAISVSTDKETLITITQLDSNKTTAELFTKTGVGSLNVRVSPGKYIVSINKKNNSASRLIEVERRKTKDVEIQPPSNAAYEPVINKAAAGLSADADALSFLNSETEVVSTIDKTNQLKEVSLPSGVKEVKWADPTYGVGVSANNELFVFRGGMYTKLTLPKPVDQTTLTGFTVSPERDVYISMGKDIYKYQPTKKFEKIYTSSAPIPVLEASKNTVSLISPPPNAERDATQNEEMDSYFVENIDMNGKLIAKKEIPGNNGIWSPDGNKLLIANFFGEKSLGNSGWYDKNLNPIGSLPNTRISSIDWLDNNRLVYAVDNSLWLYDTNSQQAETITYISSTNTVLDVTGSGSSLFYFSYKDQSSGDSYILKSSPDDASFDSKLVGLSVFLPVSLDDCLIDYVNFKNKPSIIMRVFKENLKVCRSQAEIELTQDGFNPSNFNYRANILLPD